jgi:hypothetical protein
MLNILVFASRLCVTLGGGHDHASEVCAWGHASVAMVRVQERVFVSKFSAVRETATRSTHRRLRMPLQASSVVPCSYNGRF